MNKVQLKEDNRNGYSDLTEKNYRDKTSKSTKCFAKLVERTSYIVQRIEYSVIVVFRLEYNSINRTIQIERCDRITFIWSLNSR